MTQQELNQLLTEVIGAADAVSGMIGVLDPELIPLLAIGQAFDKVIPGLATMVKGWIEGNPPTQDEKDAMLKKLAVLADPNNP